MSKQEIVDTKRYNDFRTRMTQVEADFKSASQSLANYWWNLWEIYRESLWDAAYESAEEWIGDVSTEEWGPSRSQFYYVMRAVKNWYEIGINGNEAKAMLGDPRVALRGDLREWFDRKGKLLPSIEKRLSDEGTTAKEVVKRAASLGPGEARKEVRRFVHTTETYVNKQAVSFDEKGGRLMFNVRRENERGLEGEWTFQVTCSQIKPDTKDKSFPPELASWLLKQLGAL